MRQTGHGRIENLFPLRRGFAVVVTGVVGRISRDGVLEFDDWRWPYSGPDEADLLPVAARRFSLTVEDSVAAKVLRVGGALSFYDSGES